MESRQSLLKTKESISLIKDILNTLLNAETGKRGYQLTGKEEFLEPLDKSGKEYPCLLLIEIDLILKINSKTDTASGPS